MDGMGVKFTPAIGRRLLTLFKPTRPLQQVIYTDDSFEFLKSCGLAAITGVSLSLLQT